MSREAILAAIEACGRERCEQLRRETATRIVRIEAQAATEAAAARADALAAALAPLAAEEAGRLQQARLEALHLVGQAREEGIEAVLNGARECLAALREQPSYPAVWRRLLHEALQALGQEANNGQPLLAIDPRDEPLAREAVAGLERALQLAPTLQTWGGVVVTGHDRRVVVDNTLEARFDRAGPLLRRTIAARLEAAEAQAAPATATVQKAPAAP